MKTRVVTRVIVYKAGKILLSRNKGDEHWYPGGGGLEEDETLEACAIREVKEETGQDVVIKKLMYIQEFYFKENERFLEFFFLASPKIGSRDKHDHEDIDQKKQAKVVENRWFTEKDMKNVTVYPVFMRRQFWRDIQKKEPGNKNYFVGRMQR